MVDIFWEDERARKFVNSVALIASNGKYGHNFMSCEWAHQISYSPARVSISIAKETATFENIREKNFFGMSILNEDQNIVSSICGNVSKKDVDKISVLKALGYEFVKGEKIDVLLLKDACLNIEALVEQSLDVGSHVMFIGNVVNAKIGNKNKKPLIYYAASYWRFGEKIEKPKKEVLDKISAIIEKFRIKG